MQEQNALISANSGVQLCNPDIGQLTNWDRRRRHSPTAPGPRRRRSSTPGCPTRGAAIRGQRPCSWKRTSPRSLTWCAVTIGGLIVQRGHPPRGLGPAICSNPGSKRPWGWPYSGPRAARVSGVNAGESPGPCRRSCRAGQQVRGSVVLARKGRSGTLTRKRSLVQIQYGPPGFRTLVRI